MMPCTKHTLSREHNIIIVMIDKLHLKRGTFSRDKRITLLCSRIIMHQTDKTHTKKGYKTRTPLCSNSNKRTPSPTLVLITVYGYFSKTTCSNERSHDHKSKSSKSVFITDLCRHPDSTLRSAGGSSWAVLECSITVESCVT